MRSYAHTAKQWQVVSAESSYFSTGRVSLPT